LPLAPLLPRGVVQRRNEKMDEDLGSSPSPGSFILGLASPRQRRRPPSPPFAIIVPQSATGCKRFARGGLRNSALFLIRLLGLGLLGRRWKRPHAEVAERVDQAAVVRLVGADRIDEPALRQLLHAEAIAGEGVQDCVGR